MGGGVALQNTEDGSQTVPECMAAWPYDGSFRRRAVFRGREGFTGLEPSDHKTRISAQHRSKGRVACGIKPRHDYTDEGNDKRKALLVTFQKVKV